MKKIVLILMVVVLAVAGYFYFKSSKPAPGVDDGKNGPLALKTHSDAFNASVAAAMNAYFDVSAAFVNADTANVKAAGTRFLQLMDSIPMEELKKDTSNIYDIAMGSFGNIKANTSSMLSMTDIQEMRKDFSMVSENLYPFFQVINYEGEPLYWQNCPMAFGDDVGANWISNTKDIVNPYLGKNHPVYQGSMLRCGMIKDTIKAK